MDNMKYYEAARAVPPEAQKTFNNGSFSGTDINPMWRIKKLTEMFGPAGIGWYTEVVSERAEAYGETVMAIVDINLYIKVDGEWSRPIFGTGGNLLVQATKSGARPSDEGYKKAYTDALSIACKALGIGADIWYSKDPDVCDPTSKYSDRYVKGSDQEPEPEIKIPTCERCGNPITGVALSDGTKMTASEVIAKSKLSYNGVYCIECMKELKKRKAG